METAMANWKVAVQIEKELQAQLKKDLPLFDDIEHLITQMRIACEATIFLDFEYATKEGVEYHLWDAHSYINNRYRKMVNHYRSGDHKKHIVEKRKLEKRYADFIKTSQFFYKGYIQRLASHFSGMTGLRRIANRLSLNTPTIDDRVKVSPKVEQLIELSCHFTLLRLGDLSRYRNELRTKDRSWEPALAYYQLASDLYPDSGSAHNQMAVIALADGNHLDAVYHLYRALAVKEPHPLAKGNLEIEFKKITTAWERGPKVKTDVEATLVLWFVRLHAKLYKGIEFSTHEELEKEVLYRLTLLLKDQTFETTLEKFIIINIAAEYFAGERVKEQGTNATQETVQSYFFFLRFNVRMITVFLDILLPELAEPSAGEDLPNTTITGAREKITVVARRILPALRKYSIWLVYQARIIVAQVSNGIVNSHIKEMWKTYCAVLTRLANFFPVEELPSINYLFEEDESTIGFKPFRDPLLTQDCDFYTDSNGLKSRTTDPGIERSHPNVEMLARVRDILLCGLTLTVNPDYPINLNVDACQFLYAEPSLPVSTPTNDIGTNSSSRPTSAEYSNNSSYLEPKSIRHIDDVVALEDDSAGSDSQFHLDREMHRMVESLLEPSGDKCQSSNETSYGMHSRTANDIYASLNANDPLVFQQATPKLLPSLPGIWNSPFTPKPNELKATGSERPTTAYHASSPQRSYGQNPYSADVMFPRESRNSKGGKSSYQGSSMGSLSNPLHKLTSDATVDMLAQQYIPTQASEFSSSSSIYTSSLLNTRYNAGLAYGNNSTTNGYDSSTYPRTTDFDKSTMLQSSLFSPSYQYADYVHTPPGGQGG